MSQKVEVKNCRELNVGDIKSLTKCFAILTLIINIFLPGVGTMIGGCKIGGLLGKSFLRSGILQLILAPCIIGWIWAICTSCTYIKMSENPMMVNEALEIQQIQAKV
jgi:hypothetical protein